jgi:predicted phage terminase large subunit-like protein
MNPKAEAAELLLKRRKARSNLLDFTRFTFPEYRVNWHHRLICQKLDEFLEGENKRLIISCPPRHGKSELVSRRFPAYILGRNPDTKIIACSYSSDLASLLNRDVQRIIDSPEYQELFPETRLNSANVRTTAQENYLRNSDIFEIVGHNGVYRSSGVGGSITGMGGNCLTGDTLILTNFGAIRIDFLVNSYKYNKWHNNRYRVLSYDHDNERPVWRRIEATRCIRSSRILEITTASGNKISVTPEHRIFVHDKGYTEARNLQQGDRIYYCNKPEKQRVPVLRDYRKGKGRVVQEVLSEPSESISSSQMLAMRGRIREKAIRIPQMLEERLQGCLLFENLLECSPRYKECKELRDMRSTDAGEESQQILLSRMPESFIRSNEGKRLSNMQGKSGQISKTYNMCGMWGRLPTNITFNNLLLKRMRRYRTREEDERGRELELQRWDKYNLYETIRRNETDDFRERQPFLRSMRLYSKPARSSHKRDKNRRRTNKFNNSLQTVSRYTSRLSEDTISTITEYSGESYQVYDIQVEGTNNFFANSILVHNCLIIDDPFRSRADAESPTIREKTWEWYTSTFRTRRQKGASILVTATRWHENDITGKLLELAQNDPNADQWEVINLPALSEEEIAPYDLRTEPNQALWPEEYPVSDLLSTKASSTVYEWLSLYQQRPSAAAGNLVKREHFKYCTLKGDLLDLGGDKRFILPHCTVFQTCDPAASTKTSADYFVLATWVQTPQNDLALIDLIRTRLETPDQVPLFKQQFQRWKPAFQAVESRGLGISLYQTLVREGLSIKKLDADTDKVTRFIPAATRIAAGAVYFLEGASWLNDYETELLGFPNAAHDDQVDVTSYAVQIVIESRNTKAEDYLGLYRTKSK